MILKGNQRGGANQLARHLLNVQDNEHVHVHELRGFTSADLHAAFQEAYAVSRATKAKQFLFSLSLNPPQEEKVRTKTFEAAIEAAEIRLGLQGQPRAIVFHEKEGRRHAHAVWSRIDAEKMRAINLPFFKKKLNGLARELHIEHGWQMPRGFVNSRERDPANYTLAEWQQAKRAGVDPKALKGMFQELWASSDCGKAFGAALKARGYTLARGDRRGYVAVDHRGEVYAISRYTGIKTKDVRSRLGDEKALPSIDQAKAEHASRMTAMLQRHIREAEARRKLEAESLAARRREVIQRQRKERALLEKEHQIRLAMETRERTQRFSRGFRGLWDRLTGKHAELRAQNERETMLAFQRDRVEQDALIFRQLEERRVLYGRFRQETKATKEQITELRRDVADLQKVVQPPTPVREAKAPRPTDTPPAPSNLRERFRQSSQASEKLSEKLRSRLQDRGYERDR
jgi:hypothetical protein